MCILAAMSWKRILGFAVITFVLVMVGALIYEAFDIHDTKPYLTDPECLLMMLSCLLIFCMGLMGSIRNLCRFCLSLAELLPFEVIDSPSYPMFRHATFESGTLLFSPPLSTTSLRI